ncbi:MAG: insulinase family protein [Acidobacteria bacterium]|nr:insulinase family protein [Acidobacteriota bacterium]MCL5286955.1 insulinase family protein [Acidobacteriota bacterium]
MNIQNKFSSRMFGSFLAAALLVAAPVAAQAPPQPGQDKSIPLSKVERKNKAPVSKEILRVKLPKPSETTLANGLTVLILEDHRFPTVSVTLNIDGAGALYEPINLPGLASGTALLLREGTTTRDSKKMAEDVDKLGATLTANAQFGSAAAAINASGLSDNMDEWFPLLVDILQNPTFPADEFAKLKARQKIQVKQVRSIPGFLVAERFNRAVFGSHPAATIFPTEASIDAITPELLAKWHRERYVPQNAILGIAGDVNTPALLAKLKTWLGGWSRTDLKPELPPNPVPPTAMKIYLVNRPGSVQTDVAIGNIAISRSDPDYPAVVVMNRIVGGGPAARLFMNLREEKGYTYGVYSTFNAVQYPGPWQAGGNMRSEVTEGAMTEFFKEFRRIREEPVPASEMDESIRSVVASFALSLESPQQLLNYAIVRKIYKFPADYWDTYPAKISAVTAADVARVAKKFINPENIQVVAVGEAAKIKAVLDKFGPVEVYDTEGKPVAAKPAAAPGN